MDSGVVTLGEVMPRRPNAVSALLLRADGHAQRPLPRPRGEWSALVPAWRCRQPLGQRVEVSHRGAVHRDYQIAQPQVRPLRPDYRVRPALSAPVIGGDQNPKPSPLQQVFRLGELQTLGGSGTVSSALRVGAIGTAQRELRGTVATHAIEQDHDHIGLPGHRLAVQWPRFRRWTRGRRAPPEYSRAPCPPAAARRWHHCSRTARPAAGIAKMSVKAGPASSTRMRCQCGRRVKARCTSCSSTGASRSSSNFT